MIINVKKKKSLRQRLEDVDQKLASGEGRIRDLSQNNVRPDREGEKHLINRSSAAPYATVNRTITDCVRSINELVVHYRFHQPCENTVACHVRRQLHDRIIRATHEEKDLYFLTAFLDRSALDVDVQNFRKNHPNFKADLIQCWNEDNKGLTRIIQNVRRSTHDGFEVQSPTLEKIYLSAPGRFKLNQILICLKLVKEIYMLSKDANITKIISDFTEEVRLRKYLLTLYGVGYKLADWSITNVTGHWFVVDMHIKNAILKHRLYNGKVQAEDAHRIFSSWFGILDESKRQYSLMSQEQFGGIFQNFLMSECEYLPFIMTQYLWFHGKFGVFC